MKAFLSALVEVAKSKADDPFLFGGDFNTGIGPADGPLKNFGDVDRFTALQTVGFTDVWRHVHRDRIEHTWCRTEKSYRIDHALVSASLLARVRDCRYSHQERIDGVSDHSVLLVEIE
jgi:exonuclease III